MQMINSSSQVLPAALRMNTDNMKLHYLAKQPVMLSFMDLKLLFLLPLDLDEYFLVSLNLALYFY